MAIDISNNNPWQDPFNPWPRWNSAYISWNTDTGSTSAILLEVSSFQNNESQSIMEYLKETEDASYSLICTAESNECTWTVQYAPFEGDELILYTLTTSSKSLPIKIQNVNTGWSTTDDSTAEGLSSLQITPNYSTLSNWERNRLHVLGYI